MALSFAGKGFRGDGIFLEAFPPFWLVPFLIPSFLRFVPALPRTSLDVPSPKKLSPARLFGPCGTLLDSFLVPRAGLEPAQQLPLPPQDSVSTSSTTSAWGMFLARFGKLGKHFLCAWLRRNFMGKIRTLTRFCPRLGGWLRFAPGVGPNLFACLPVGPLVPRFTPLSLINS